MHADGLTKGSVDRKGIHDIMTGTVTQNHEIKIRISKDSAPLQGVSGDHEEAKHWPPKGASAVPSETYQ